MSEQDQSAFEQKINQRLAQISSLNTDLAQRVALVDPETIDQTLRAQVASILRAEIVRLAAIVEIFDLTLARDAAARNVPQTEQQTKSSEPDKGLDEITSKESSHGKGSHAESRPSGSHGSKSQKERQHGSKKK